MLRSRRAPIILLSVAAIGLLLSGCTSKLENGGGDSRTAGKATSNPYSAALNTSIPFSVNVNTSSPAGRASFSCRDSSGDVYLRSCALSLISGPERDFAVITIFPKELANSSKELVLSDGSIVLKDDPIILNYVQGKITEVAYIYYAVKRSITIPLEQDKAVRGGSIEPVTLVIDLTGQRPLSDEEVSLLLPLLSRLERTYFPLESDAKERFNSAISELFNSEGISTLSILKMEDKLEKLWFFSNKVEVFSVQWHDLSGSARVSPPFCEGDASVQLKFNGGSRGFFSLEDCTLSFDSAQKFDWESEADIPEYKERLPDFFEAVLVSRNVATGEQNKLFVHVAVDKEECC